MLGRPSGTGGAELKAIVGEHGVDVVKDGCDLWTGRQIGYRSPRLPLRRGFQVDFISPGQNRQAPFICCCSIEDGSPPSLRCPGPQDLANMHPLVSKTNDDIQAWDQTGHGLTGFQSISLPDEMICKLNLTHTADQLKIDEKGTSM